MSLAARAHRAYAEAHEAVPPDERSAGWRERFSLDELWERALPAVPWRHPDLAPGFGFMQRTAELNAAYADAPDEPAARAV